MASLIYPQTQKIDQVDNYHGTLVPDPYRWLEDTDSVETKAWVAAQNQVTFGFLEKIPARERIRKRMTELWDFPKAYNFIKVGDRYFQPRNTGVQNQNVLFVQAGLQEEARVLIDPNTLAADGTVAMTQFEASKDGKWVAYALNVSGSDWMTWRIRSVDRLEDLPDRIEWSKFSSAAWLPDSTGFFYASYDTPQPGQSLTGVNYNQKIYLHVLNTSQAQDTLVYQRPDQKEWAFTPIVSEDGKYLVLHVWLESDICNWVFYKALAGNSEIVELISELEAAFEFLGNDGPLFYFRTDLNAPRGRLVAIDVTRPQKENWATLIPESRDVLESVRIVHDQFICLYQRDAHHLLYRYNLKGELLGEIALPMLGSVMTPYGYPISGSRADDELFFLFSSFVCPVIVYRYDFNQDACQKVFSPPVPFNFDPYEVNQVFVPSKDGTWVPMFLIHRKDLLKDGQNPTLLYGYGGFSISIMPDFTVNRLVWLEMGGVLAVANLRGGGEYGDDWHRAGTIHRKQNVFDDFIACAEYLIAKKYTSTPKLAIQGDSNGGLLVGACMTQRPELYGAALPAVGVMDMLRFHKFTIGWSWTSDYGSSDDPDQFKTLYAYSPLHNIKPGTHYPPILITTADHDDRVVPGHSFKFAATLQAAQEGDAPALIRIQTKAGHGMGKPTSIIIAETTDLWASLVQALGMSQ